MSFFEELRRRNVIRVGIAYVVLAWLVMQVADVVFDAIAAPDWVMKTVLAMLALGLPFAIFFAWAFELTPEGLKREHEVDRSQSITHHTGRKLDFLIIGILVLALGYFVYDKFVLDAQRDTALVEATTQALSAQSEAGDAAEETPNSIAVLAFNDMSQAGDQAYLSDGIAEELLNLLAKIPDLRVTSRSSAFSFKDKDLPLTEIAQQLNVAHILEGSVRKAGNRVRITAQLIDARSDTHLWSATYDRELDDIFAIQDEIAATVVDQLKITLLGEAPHVQEVDPEAYALFLQGRHLRRQNSEESMLQSIDLLQQALVIEPEYAAAWMELGGNYASGANNGLMPYAEGYALARDAGEKTLAIDPGYAPAHILLGYITLNLDNDLAKAAMHYARGYRLDPDNLMVVGNTATMLQALGRLDEAIAMKEYAVARDPINPIGHANLGNAYLLANRWDQAIGAYQAALRLSSDYISAHSGIGTALLFQDKPEAALAHFELKDDELNQLAGQAQALHTLGEHARSDSRLAELIENHERNAAYYIAGVFAYRGEVDLAFEWLDKTVQYDNPLLADVVDDPSFKNIHNDPRWLPFLESIGKSAEQLAAIEFDVTLPGQN